MPEQSRGCCFLIGWQEAPLRVPPPLLPQGVKRTGLIWDHTVEGAEPTKGEASGTHLGSLDRGERRRKMMIQRLTFQRKSFDLKDSVQQG